MGVDRRPRSRRLRPPDHREHAARLHDPGRRRARGLGRGRLLRRLGPPGGTRRREAAAGPRPRALARVPALVRDDGGAAARARRGPGLAGDDLVHRRRCAHGLRRRGRSREAPEEPRLPDRLLALPESAPAARATGRQTVRHARGGRPDARPRALRRRPAAGRELEADLARDVRQLRRRARAERAPRAAHDPPQRAGERRGVAARATLHARSHAGAPAPLTAGSPSAGTQICTASGSTSMRSVRPFLRSPPSISYSTLRSSLMRTVCAFVVNACGELAAFPTTARATVPAHSRTPSAETTPSSSTPSSGRGSSNACTPPKSLPTLPSRMQLASPSYQRAPSTLILARNGFSRMCFAPVQT